MHLYELLKEAANQRASDVHLVPGMHPLYRVDGQILPLVNVPRMTSDQIQDFVLPLLNERQKGLLTSESCVDFSTEIHDFRYRGNVLIQRNGLEVVFRLIPTTVPTPEEIMMPPALAELANLRSGLVLVTGPTGSGKSTTMACLINLMNERRHGNIITIEDPIEFVFQSKNCIISQREIGTHAPSFASALRYVMRQDPDVVMVGEMRDLETISTAITVAETGHLVLGTLHATEASQAIDRMIDVFPAHQQHQIRTQLSAVLRAVVSQTLMPRARSRGRIPVREIMLVTTAISSLIRTNKIHEIPSAIEMGTREGMVSLKRALTDLATKGLIDWKDANAMLHGNTSKGRGETGPAAAA